MQTRTCLSSLALCLGLWACASVPARAVDRTGAYLGAAFGPAELRELRGHRVLFVEGLNPETSPQGFAEQMAWLADLGVSYQRVGGPGAQRPADNTLVLAAAIADSPKTVIIVSHGEGGLDALHALVERADLRAKVRGWAAIQSPLRGRPERASRPAGFTNGEFDGGDLRDALSSAAAPDAQRFNKAHAAELKALLAAVPTVAFGSSRAGRSAGSDPRYAATGPALDALGLVNDGTVPIYSTALPGMDTVWVAGVGHGDPVNPKVRSFDRVKQLKSLLCLLLTRPDP